MNVLAVSAHPDDIELLCAGTLIRYAEAGHRVTFAVFTDGSMGDLKIPPAELAQTREAEARAAADMIGARLLWVGVTDEHVFPEAHQRRLMIDVLREADPDVIFTHAPHDYHPDHRGVSQLVFDSYFQKGLPHIPDQRQPACRFGDAHLYYMDTVCGIDSLPMEYVDVTSIMETKRKMLACHRSQFVPFRDIVGLDLMEIMETQSRTRGLAAGCRFAEGFTRCTAHPRGLAARLLP